MSVGQDFADLVNDFHARVEAALRAAGGHLDMSTSDATLAASIALDEVRPGFMLASHRLLEAVEKAAAAGHADPDVVTAARALRSTYPR